LNSMKRMLYRRHTKSVDLPLRKGDLGPRTSCECGQVYIGQRGHSVDIRLKDHQRHIRLEQPDKAAVSERSVNLGYHIQIDNNCILATRTRYMGHVLRDATHLELCPINMNREDGFCLSKWWREATHLELCPINMSREDGFCLSKRWKPLLRSLREYCEVPRSLYGCVGPHSSCIHLSSVGPAHTCLLIQPLCIPVTSRIHLSYETALYSSELPNSPVFSNLHMHSPIQR
jgi:hypothetical protein